MTYTLAWPFIKLEWDRKPNYWKTLVGLWTIGGLAFVTTLLYLYAVLFAEYVGFETALLTGVGLLVIAVSGGD